MRDSFGGVFMIRLFLVFIFIYVAFSAVSINYAKAFKLKNSIISFIEENEIISLNDMQKYETELNTILKKSQYTDKVCNNGNGPIQSEEGITNGYCYNGIVIGIKSTETIEGKNSTIIKYNVYTYADWNLGIINKIFLFNGERENKQPYVSSTWEIVGEAVVVKR